MERTLQKRNAALQVEWKENMISYPAALHLKWEEQVQHAVFTCRHFSFDTAAASFFKDLSRCTALTLIIKATKNMKMFLSQRIGQQAIYLFVGFHSFFTQKVITTSEAV